MIRVIVRDGRFGRDPAQVEVLGGEVLRTYISANPVAEGDRVALEDGTEVVVIGTREEISADGWTITVFVGDVL